MTNLELKPKLYDYFLEKGIKLKFNEIRHWIDKKAVKGFRRAFFVNTFTQDAQCLITAKGVLGVQLYYVKLELKEKSSQFYIDIPVSRYRWITKYEIIVQKDNKAIWTGTVKKSGEFERLI
jgi:hypothetical protein